MGAKKILIVDDDVNICELLRLYLSKEGFDTVVCNDGESALRLAIDDKPDLVLLDIMLPKLDGWQVCREIRKVSEKPIIMVTAKVTEMDMIKGLDEGADDYIKKPFSIMELITRVKALLRRTTTEEVKLLQLDELVMDHERHMVYVDGQAIELTFKEYELLRLLLNSPGIVMTREVIMRQVWGTEFEGESRTLDMHIKTLRKKLGDAGGRIKTVRNVGYVIE